MTGAMNQSEEETTEIGSLNAEMTELETRIRPTEIPDLDIQTTEKVDTALAGVHTPNRDHHPHAEIDTETTGAGGNGVVHRMVTATRLTSGGG